MPRQPQSIARAFSDAKAEYGGMTAGRVDDILGPGFRYEPQTGNEKLDADLW
jgi:hypothetical protein